ncbi:MAG: hypothetical protein LAO03_09560 [Acidobacteriia bacterium]|nr:hypothetical protein [Terriglobia bacterium]
MALDIETRIRNAGQPIHGKVVEPVYAFDKLVVPSGTEITGKVTAIDAISKKRRTLAAMNADFSPERQIHIEFDELRLGDGRQIPLATTVSPGSQGVLQFVPAKAQAKEGIGDRGKTLASRKASGVRQEIRHDWETAKQQIHEPGKVHRLERFAVAQLPYRPQYLDAGASFNADLQQPLDFGTETLKPETLSAIGTPPPAGSVVHAQLVTALNSATAKKGEPVEAVITQPLFVADQLFLPQGSRIQGTVLQARPARRLGRNGHLRIVFHQVVPPSGIEQKVEASLEAVEAAKAEHLSLDSEGGAEVTTPRTRYLTTGIAVALASASVAPDHEREVHGGGDPGGSAANGASGFKLVGTVVGALVHSRVVASGFGFYGAGMSVYSHFLARGRDVVYPKDMSMVIGLGTRDAKPAVAAVPSTHSEQRPIGPL